MVTPCEKTVQENLHTDISGLLKNVSELVKAAKERSLTTRSYIGYALGSKHSADIDPKKVNEMAERLMDMKVDEVVIQDNIASGTMEKVETLLNTLTIPKSKLGVHFHDSKFIGMDLIMLALSKGITNIDCAVAGMGQCYYNKTMLGNMVTEDLLFIFDTMGIEHGVNWEKLLDTGDFICEHMTRENCTDAFDVDFKEDLDDYKKKYIDLLNSLK
jgi:hydroxymethylglutaryl-CoA lyase